MKHDVEPESECYNEEWIPDKEQEEGFKHFVEHWDIHVVSKYWDIHVVSKYWDIHVVSKYWDIHVVSKY